MRSALGRKLATCGTTFVASLALTVSISGPAVAADTVALPSLPTPLNVPGAQNALNQIFQEGANSSLLGGGKPGGGATVDGNGRTNINLPLVPTGGIRKQYTTAPAVEQSTRPNCAPFMLVAVPGTFEINRDDDPNKATGLLAKLTSQLKSVLGDKFSYTMINYDADAGVNGTSYLRSTENGKQKTLATMADVASRCANANIILAGYSQGGDIAGDIATDIGNKRTPIDPARVSAVALFSDPQRAENSNVIVGTNQSRPDVPAFLQKAFGALANDPSFAQMQLNLGNTVQSLIGQSGMLAGQRAPATSTRQDAGAPSSTDTPTTGDTSDAPRPEPQSTESPSPSTIPDAGSTPTSTPDMAGASYLTRGRVRLITDAPQANPTDLPAVKDGDRQTGDRDPNTGSILATIDRSGRVMPFPRAAGTGPNVPASAEEISRRAHEGHVWNRSNADKSKRRLVIDALFVYQSETCKGKTLAQCRTEYVDAGDGVHPGLLVPSADLNAMVTQLAGKPENANLQLPDGATLDRLCGGQQAPLADACRRKLQWSAASEPSTVRSANLGGLSAGTADAKTFETLARAMAVSGENGNTPITSLGKQNQGIRMTDSSKVTSLVACKNSADNQNLASSKNWQNWVNRGFPEPHSYEGTQGSGYNHQSNSWLLGAWQIALKERDGKRLLDMDRTELLARDGDLSDCYAWAALTAQDFLKKYLSHQIVYNDDNFVPPNGARPAPNGSGSTATREASVGQLYSYGGCGPIQTGSGVEALAPSGTWSLDTCRSEYLGQRSRYGQISDSQLAQFVATAKAAYEQKKPAWIRDVLTLDESGIKRGDPNTVTRTNLRRTEMTFGCGPYAVNQCAAYKTRILAAPSAPAGQQRYVLPMYPTMVNGKLVAPKTDSELQTVTSQDQVPPLTDRGFILADDAVLAQVQNLDLANKAYRDSPAANPNKAYTLIKRETPKTATNTSREGDPNAAPGTVKDIVRQGLSQDEIDQHLAHGWVWGRTDAQNRERPGLVYGIYTLGGCSGRDKQQQTWRDCFDKYAGTGDAPQPENALNNDELRAIIAQLQPHVGELPWVSTSFPADLNRECRDKIAEQCARQKQTPTTTPTTTRAPDTTAPTTRPTRTTEVNAPDTDETTDPDASTTAPAPSDTTTPETTPIPVGDTTESTSPSESTVPDAGASSTTTTERNAGAPDGADGGLADYYANLITGGQTDSSASATTVAGHNGDKVSVTPITQRAVSGGGLAGPRDSGFGQLTGRVVSFCVPGDLVCSLPANSELARDLTKFAQNLSVNFPDMLSDEGATKMGGLLALQGLNMVADITGMPRTKLSASTLQALINIAAGGVMVATENPAGAALIADGLAKLPDAIPEVFKQLQDIPEILRNIPTTPDTVLKNTGLDKQIARITAAFKQAGMTSPLEIDKYPAAANALMEGLVKDNTGVVQLVTNPQYWKVNAHLLYPELKVAGDMNSVAWVQQWINALLGLVQSR